MKRSSSSTENIYEALGHTNIKATEIYLNSFEKELKREFFGKLVSLKMGVSKPKSLLYFLLWQTNYFMEVIIIEKNYPFVSSSRFGTQCGPNDSIIKMDQ